MFEIIDSMIATVTVVLVLSLIVQAIQQIVKQLFNMKSKFMERELFAVLARVEYKRSILPVKFQYHKLAQQHPEVRDLLGKISRRLSSIGYDNLAIIESMGKEDFLKIAADLFDTGEMETADTSTMSDVEKGKLSGKIKFLQQTRLDLDRWYDVTMKAFQEHYERRMKMWAYILSGLVVLWLNANLFEIYREFSTNKVLRETAVKLGERFASTPRESFVAATADTQANQRLSDSASFHVIKTQIKNIDSLVNAQSFAIMRWNSPTGTPIEIVPGEGGLVATLGLVWKAITRNFFGWIGMTLLVGLGAPFWYDILKTLVGVKERLRARSNGGGETPQEQGSRTTQEAPMPAQAPPPAVG